MNVNVFLNLYFRFPFLWMTFEVLRFIILLNSDISIYSLAGCAFDIIKYYFTQDHEDRYHDFFKVPTALALRATVS